MIHRLTWLFIFSGFVFFLHCSKESTSPPAPETLTPAKLNGVWNAGKYQVMEKANPALSYDLVALGGSVEMKVGGSQYLLTIAFPAFPAQRDSGRVEIVQDSLRFASQVFDDSTLLKYLYKKGELSLKGEDQLDIDMDGEIEGVLVDIIFLKK